MSDFKNVRVYRGNNNNNNIKLEDKEVEYNDKYKDNKDIKDNFDYTIGLTMRSTRIIPEEDLSNKKTNKTNNLRMPTKKKSTAQLNNKLIYIGDIEQAKIHSNANRPLKKVGEFDSKTQFCKCCGLPCEKIGVMEKYKWNDSTEEFIKHGQVISLYFSFYIYSIFILSYTFLAISLPTIILTNQRTKELNKICKEMSNMININECFIYSVDNEKGTNYSSILDFSGLNIKNYKTIHLKLTQNTKDNADKIIVNYSVLNFIGLITILFLNFGYILLLYNQIYLPNLNIITPRNYSIIITEMYGYSYLKKKFSLDANTNNDVDIDEKKNKKPSLIEVAKKNSERGKLDDKEEVDEISDVEKFKNLFKEKIAEIFLDKNKKHKKYNINQVNVCFKINEYMKKEEKLERCNECIEKIESLPYQKAKNDELKLKDDEKGDENNGEKDDKKGNERYYFYSPLSEFGIHLFEKKIPLSKLQKEKEDLEKDIDLLLKESKKINMDKFAGAVIISFNTIKEKEDFLSNFPNNFFTRFLKIAGKLRYFFCFCCIKKIDNTEFWQKLKIQIQEAPEPEDVVFENLEFTTMTKTYRVVGMNMISLLLIGIGFGIIFGLQNLQNYVNKKKYNRFLYYLISLCITIVSSVINMIFQYLLNFLTKTEKLKSISTYYLSYSVKLTLFSFLVSGIIPLICDIISDSENYEILISNMIVMFLVNSIVTPLLWTFSPLYYLKKTQIFLIERNEKPNLYHNLNQKELNKLYELSDMDISYKYSYIAKTLLMTFLYISIFPFGVPISLGGFFFCYYLEKYNYLNYYKRPEMLNNDLYFFYVNNFVFFLFFLGIGDYIFLSDIYSTKGWSLANIIILGILIVVPYQYLLNHDFIGLKESEINKLTYDEAYLEFFTDYERSNPMTKREGMENYIKKLFEEGKIDKRQKDNYLKNIENINLMKAYYENRQNVNLIKIQKMLRPLQELKLMKNLSFKPTVNKKFKLSGNLKSLDANFKSTVVLRGENNKGRNLKLIDQKEKENSEEKKQNELLIPEKKIDEIKEINKLNEEEMEEKIEKEKSIDKCSQKEIEVKIEEKELDWAKETKHIREYYKDPILQRMVCSIKEVELLQTNEENNYADNSIGKICEIDELNLQEDDSRICYEFEGEKEEKEKSEGNNNNKDEDINEKSEERNSNFDEDDAQKGEFEDII